MIFATQIYRQKRCNNLGKSYSIIISDKNKITLIIAHKLSTITNADKIIVLEDGIISGLGTHEELLHTNKMYKDIYDI